MGEKVGDALFQKIFERMGGGFAYCELLVDTSGRPIDYRFLKVNTAFQNQANSDFDTIVGKTFKEILPGAKKSWIETIYNVVLSNKSIQFVEFNHLTNNYYHTNVFSETGNKFFIVIDDITSERIAIEKRSYQNNEKEKRSQELVIANKELKFQRKEKEKRAAELEIANKELAFQNDQKEKRAVELALANYELAYQNSEKEKRSQELVLANIELEFQKKEKEKQAIELIRMQKKMEESDRFKSVFLAKMCQEIRTPMNGVLGFSELLKNTNLNDEKQQDYIQIIENFGNNMLIELDFLASLFKPNFIKFEEVIHENLYSNRSVKELAFLCNMSLSSFKRKFAEVYAISPIKYFMKIKLQKASELLIVKSNLISNIAHEVGFESLTTFNRSFKLHYGKSPSRFRVDETD